MQATVHLTLKNNLRHLGVISLAILFVGGLPWSPLARAEDAITFGAALSLTGKTATEGVQVKDGYDFYVDHINQMGGINLGGKKYKVAIKYYDDESSAATSAKLYEKLIAEDGIKLLLGPYSSGITMAASAVTEKYKVPMVLAHGAALALYDRGFRYIFGTLTPVDQYTANYIKMAADAQPRGQRLALVQENDLFPKQAIEGAAQQAKAAKLDIVYTGTYPTGTKDFSSMVEAIKASNPDVLIAAGYTGDMLTLTRQIAEQGLKVKMFGVMLGPTLPGYIDSLGKLAEGQLEPIQWSPNLPYKDQIFGWTATEFADIYKKEKGHVPDYHPPQSMAALEVYQNAIERTGSLDPEKLRDAIAQTEMMTLYGPIKFNAKGANTAKGMLVVQVQKGKPVVVYPPDGAEGKFIYPMP
jgi:branched-chain amino acid transport system substrate-binding protein